MKDTLRRLTPKATENLSTVSISTESTSNNPWTTEILNQPIKGETMVSPQDSKSSRSSFETANGESTVQPVAAQPPTRRRKTVTKTTEPHVFELKEDHKKSDQPASKPQNPKQEPPKSPENPARQPSKPDKGDNRPATAPVPVPAPAPPAPQSPPQTPNPFTVSHRRSKSTKVAISTLSSIRIAPPSIPHAFFQKVVIITGGTSPIGSALVRLFHLAGARIIFGHLQTSASDISPTAAASNLVRSLGPPHTAHFNTCDIRQYNDLLGLFKLGRTMYGRIDHAIFLAEDGSSKRIAEAEKGWLQRDAKIEDVERGEPLDTDLGGTLAAATRFAHIAIPYLKHVPSSAKKKRSTYTEAGQVDDSIDKSLTLVSSVAAFHEMPGLPIYQITQHGVLGLVRSLRPMLEVDRVRVNAVCSRMMIARTTEAVGGRMSVKMPDDEPDDVARVVVGVVGAGIEQSGDKTRGYEGVDQGYEAKDAMGEISGRRKRANHLHGKVLYAAGGESWDIDEGLARSEPYWLGEKGCDTLRRAQEGVGQGRQWILDIG